MPKILGTHTNILDVKTKTQTKVLGSAVTATTADVTDLKFNNLEIGKRYLCYGFLARNFIGTSNPTLRYVYTNGAQTFYLGDLRADVFVGANLMVVDGGFSFEFTATATTLVFSYTETAANGSQLNAGSRATLVELPNDQATTQWT